LHALLARSVREWDMVRLSHAFNDRWGSTRLDGPVAYRQA